MQRRLENAIQPFRAKRINVDQRLFDRAMILLSVLFLSALSRAADRSRSLINRFASIRAAEMTIAPEMRSLHMSAMEMLLSAKRIFQKPSPSRSELLAAGYSIAVAVRRANDLGFKADIQQLLDEVRGAAEIAARNHPRWS